MGKLIIQINGKKTISSRGQTNLTRKTGTDCTLAVEPVIKVTRVIATTAEPEHVGRMVASSSYSSSQYQQQGTLPTAYCYSFRVP